MALQGSIEWVFSEEHESETEDVLVEYPDGSSETITQSTMVERTETFDDTYIYIKSIQINSTTFINDETGYKEKREIIYFHYAGYEDVLTRDIDNEDFLFFGTGGLNDYNRDENIWIQCYNVLKQSLQYSSDLEDC